MHRLRGYTAVGNDVTTSITIWLAAGYGGRTDLSTISVLEVCGSVGDNSTAIGLLIWGLPTAIIKETKTILFSPFKIT
jgi:hypothetical protein